MEIEDIVSYVANPINQEYFKKLFLTMRKSLLSNLVISNRKAGEYFIHAGDSCKNIYILLNGEVRLLYELPAGINYSFDKIESPAFLGETETFSECPYYRASVICHTTCSYVVLTKLQFLDWMKSSNDALFIMITSITKKMAGQTKKDRTFLFSSGENRLIYLLLDYFEQNRKTNICKINISREKLAESSCLSIKTVGRCIANLKKHKLISQTGRTIYISREQAALLEEQLYNNSIIPSS